jgi:acetyl esterase/lipase
MMPDNPFPTQLNQANVALTHLLNKGIPPSNIILGGDSGGGNLIIQLGAHILHPLSSISAPPTLTQPLAGGLLISPWNIYNVDAPSYARNDMKDVLDLPCYMFLNDLVKRGLDPELQDYSEPTLAPAGWLKGLDKVYSRFCIIAGDEECPIDQTKETRDILSRYVSDTELVIEEGSAHGEVIYRFATKEGGVGKDWDAIIAFSSMSLAGASK